MDIRLDRHLLYTTAMLPPRESRGNDLALYVVDNLCAIRMKWCISVVGVKIAKLQTFLVLPT